MKVYALSDVGRVRSVNQDAYHVPTAGENFAVVADGMGGHRAGEVASELAVKEFVRWLRCAPRPDEATLRYAVSEANRAIYYKAKAEPEKAGMGTTITGLWVDENKAYLAHIGDSRAYMLRNNRFLQLSRDHSVVAELIERGEITPEEAKHHPHRHFITRAVGTSSHVVPDIDSFDSRPGDIWLLCSDGLSNYIEDYEMKSVLMGKGNWQDKTALLMDMALQRGGADNITVLIVVIDGGAV